MSGVYSTMITKLFLVLLTLEPQQQLEQQMQRQQQQIEQIHQQFDRLLQIIERQEQRQEQQRPEPAKPVCSAEIRWVYGGDQRTIPANSDAIVPLNLFSTISKPASACLPAEIRVTASYLDTAGNLVCSGAIENLASQNTLTQSINLDIRPWNLREFARWRNEPPQINSGPKRLVCTNAEGLAEPTSEELAKVSSVRVRATVLPAGGGMSTVETQFLSRR